MNWIHWTLINYVTSKTTWLHQSWFRCVLRGWIHLKFTFSIFILALDNLFLSNQCKRRKKRIRSTLIQCHNKITHENFRGEVNKALHDTFHSQLLWASKLKRSILCFRSRADSQTAHTAHHGFRRQQKKQRTRQLSERNTTLEKAADGTSSILNITPV